jgi:hypothetical protein
MVFNSVAACAGRENATKPMAAVANPIQVFIYNAFLSDNNNPI